MTKIHSAQTLRSLKESGPDCLAQQCLLASTVLSNNCQGLVTKNLTNLNAKQRASSSGCPPLPVQGLKRAGPVSTIHYSLWPIMEPLWCFNLSGQLTKTQKVHMAIAATSWTCRHTGNTRSTGQLIIYKVGFFLLLQRQQFFSFLGREDIGSQWFAVRLFSSVWQLSGSHFLLFLQLKWFYGFKL